ncbi:hypothetical protein T8K17_25645 (plasmid) [Thalassobaculum sp. OXR-137]|uniref:ribonuclease H-like domain-containing protein n=1 Tax=Thalassobaculum sp. OXR-137 TaxID=3100173 RepID=UPI002AC95058|nr:ribonuclease H-like domain-containing protein [Thalassobaculum sp. OXR-137]WPZ37264.1 hypothetical protein T8K17_25645 [Thalassobaculum sp. OXR-137]
MDSPEAGRTRTTLALVLGARDQSAKESGSAEFLVPGQSGANGLHLGAFALAGGRISFGSTGVGLKIDHVTAHMTKGFCTGEEHSTMHEDEKSLLRALHEFLQNANQPLLITWRGTEFDVPFLQSRFRAGGLSTDDLTWSSAPLQYGLLRAQHVDLWQVQYPDRAPLTLDDALADAIVPSSETLSGIRKLEVHALGLMLVTGLTLFNKKQMNLGTFREFLDSSNECIELTSGNRPHLNVRSSHSPLYESTGNGISGP